MNCLKPISIRDPKHPSSRVQVPCGRCVACRENKAADWVTRLMVETFYSTSAYFITLTYEDHFLPINKNGYPGFSLSDMTRFIKNLRNKVPDQIRYFYVCEYGKESRRPHYHMCLWNWPSEVDLMTACGKSWVDSKGRMMSIWLPENIAQLEQGHIVYVTKYIHKKQEVPKGYDEPFMRCSRRPGIGAQLLSDPVKKFYRDAPSRHVYVNGEEHYMPRYYADRIYDTPDLKDSLLLTKARYVNTKSYKQLMDDIKRLGVARPEHSEVREFIDYETGEIYSRLVTVTNRPVGLLERAGLLNIRDQKLKKQYVNKKQDKFEKSYHF